MIKQIIKSETELRSLILSDLNHISCDLDDDEIQETIYSFFNNIVIVQYPVLAIIEFIIKPHSISAVAEFFTKKEIDNLKWN